MTSNVNFQAKQKFSEPSRMKNALILSKQKKSSTQAAGNFKI